MIAGDVGVEILPTSLDAIVVGAVRREKVKDDAAVHVGEDSSDQFAVVDAVVVDDEVNSSRAAVGVDDAKEQQREKHAVLSWRINPRHDVVVRCERACEVVLHVLSRRDDAALLSAQHPIAADARVEMDIDLVGVEHRLAFRRARCERTQLAQTTFPLLARPRAEDDRPRHSVASAELAQDASHGARSDRAESATHHFSTEQLARPRRTLPSEVLRRAAQKLGDLATKAIVDLRATVEASLIVKTVDTVGDEARRGLHDRRASERDVVGDAHAAVTETKPRDGEKSKRRRRVVASSPEPDQVTPPDAIHSRYIFHRGLFRLGVWRFPNGEQASLISIRTMCDRQSRAVI